MPKKDNLTKQERKLWIACKLKDQPRKKLCKLLNVQPQSLRDIKKTMTKKGYPIASTRDRGYFIIQTKTDKQDALEFLYKQAYGIQKSIRLVLSVQTNGRQRKLVK